MEFFPPEISEEIRPSASIRPRLYGLPKIHKDGVPLRPILSTRRSSQDKVAKWLAIVLQPVLQRFCSFCIKYSFSFIDCIHNCSSSGKFMCSFDVCSLFTCVPLLETINICCDFLYLSSFSSPDISEKGFFELMKFATSSVEFSLYNIMYLQIDGVVMGSPLGPALAYIFPVFMRRNCFVVHFLLYYIVGMWMILFIYLMKLKWINFSPFPIVSIQL